MKKKKLRNWLLTACVIGIVGVVAMVWAAGYVIEKKTNDLVYSDVNTIPHNKVGLLLGTAQYLQSGAINRYFLYRINAATTLYNAGKIDCFVISGDNSEKEYNEPLAMKNELIARGVPEDKIYLDYAGFRTYDSVIRLNKIFGQSTFTIISQEFHNRRAIYIANSMGLHAVGFNAEDVDAYNGFKTRVREKFSRVKVFIDLIINKQPKFLGEEIIIL